MAQKSYLYDTDVSQQPRHQETKLDPTERKETWKRTVLWCLLDIMLVASAVTVIFLAEYGVIPNHRGTFYCNDPKLSLRSHGETVTFGMLLIWTFLVPLLVCYIQVRVPGDLTSCLVPWLDFLFAAVALVSSITRITDHRHHWWDVLAGAILGVVIAVFTMRLFCRRLYENKKTSQSTIQPAICGN